MKQRVKQVINKWDPIDLFPMAPEDEYIKEIEIIENIIRKNKQISQEELAFEIHRIFSNRFGSDVFTRKNDECVKIACKILELVL